MRSISCEQLIRRQCEAISKLSIKPDLLLNDAVTIPDVEIRQSSDHQRRCKKRIDRSKYCCESYKDRMMKEYDTIYPGYDFAKIKDMEPKHILKESNEESVISEEHL